MSVPSCPAQLQRPAAAGTEAGHAAGMQRPGSGGIASSACHTATAPEIARNLRELRAALSLAERSSKPQLP